MPIFITFEICIKQVGNKISCSPSKVRSISLKLSDYVIGTFVKKILPEESNHKIATYL